MISIGGVLGLRTQYEGEVQSRYHVITYVSGSYSGAMMGSHVVNDTPH